MVQKIVYIFTIFCLEKTVAAVVNQASSVATGNREATHHFYARKQNIVIEYYQPSRHETGVKKLLQYGVGIGSKKYIQNIIAIEFLNKHYYKLKPLVAYKTNKNIVVGFTLIHHGIRKSIANPNIYVHYCYNKESIARLLTEKAGILPIIPPIPYSRASAHKAPQPPTFLKRAIAYATPFSAIALTFHALSTLQTMYYQRRYSSREAKKLCVYLMCGYALYRIHCTVRSPYCKTVYPDHTHYQSGYPHCKKLHKKPQSLVIIKN